jgi:hypothetical protein
VDVGDEIRVNCLLHGAQHWVRVVDVLRITAPATITMFTVDAAGLPCLADPEVTVRGSDEVMSRRGTAPVVAS